MRTDELPDNELIKGCIRGDRKRQEQLYRRFAPLMYTICLSYATGREEAMDMLQDGFIKVFRSIETYDFKGSFEGWIKRIIINTAIDHYRKTKRNDSFLDINEVQVEDEMSADALSHLGHQEIIRHLNQLPDGARMVFNLYALEGYSHKEIAEKLDISVGTSKSQFNRAKTLMKNLLGNLNVLN